MQPPSARELESAGNIPLGCDPLRVVIDANVWASGLIKRHLNTDSSTIVRACLRGVFHALFSGELIDEIAYTLIELGADTITAGEAAVSLTAYGHTFALAHQVMGCRDIEDDHLYELAVTGGASYIVTRDRAVLHPKLHVAVYLAERHVRIMRPREFVQTVLHRCG